MKGSELWSGILGIISLGRWRVWGTFLRAFQVVIPSGLGGARALGTPAFNPLGFQFSVGDSYLHSPPEATLLRTTKHLVWPRFQVVPTHPVLNVLEHASQVSRPWVWPVSLQHQFSVIWTGWLLQTRVGRGSCGSP